MDKSLLKRVAIQSVALMVSVITSSYAFEQYKTVKISASNISQEEVADTADTAQGNDLIESGMVSLSETAAVTGPVIMATSLNDLRSQADAEIMKQLSTDYLVIKKPDSDHSSIALEDLYVKKSIKISMSGAYQDIPCSSLIMRVRGEDYFLGDPIYTEVITQETDSENGSVKEVTTRDYGKDLSRGITFTNITDNKTGLPKIEILIELDSVYAYTIYEDNNYFFIDLRKPSEVYDKILVIDPGHGGKDAGALSKNEMYYEKNINLGIVLALKELLDKENIKVYYTRTADDTVFLRPRVTLANAVDCDYYISIHCNSNEVSSPNGTEVLYYDTEFNNVSSEELAKLFSDELGKTIELSNRGIVLKNKKEIFVMDKAEVPMILIEMGYLSNSMDLNYLIDQKNQRKIAQGIYNGIMKAFKELPVSRQE
jgi:N-acetylmuramoyl-L-alanine amidase